MLQILVDDREKSVINAYYVSVGINWCCVVCLKSELRSYRDLYEGVLVQISSLRTGSTIVVIISCLPEEIILQMTINCTDDTDSEESIL